MSKLTQETIAEKSPRSKRLWMGCGVFLALGLVAMIVANMLVKNYVVDQIEEGLAKKGLDGEIGELNFSLLSREIEVRNFTAMPTTAKTVERFGNVKLERGTVKFTTEREDFVEELHLEGLSSKLGSIKKLDVVSDRLIVIEGMTINNPPEFGGGPLLEFKVIKLEYAKASASGSDHFKEVRVEIKRINIVRNRLGLWLTDLSKKDEKKMSEKKAMAAIDKLTITVGEISFQDLASNDPPMVVKVNKEITVDDPENPRAYPLIVFPKLLWISRQAKKKFGIN